MKDKFILFIKKNFTILLFGFVIIICLLNFNYMLSNSNALYYIQGREDERIIGTNTLYLMYGQDVNSIEQEFIAEKNNLSKIDIYIGNVSNKEVTYLLANMIIGLKDSNNNIICEYKYGRFHFDHNNVVTIPIPNIKNSKNKKYKLYINHMKDKESNVVFLTDYNFTKKENIPFGTLKIDDDTITNTLSMAVGYKSNNNVLITNTIVSIISIASFAIIIFINKSKISLEKIYIIIALFISIGMIFLLPLFNGSDEESHWARAYEISEGKMLSGIVDDWPTSKFSKSIFDISNNNSFKRSLSKLSVEYNEDEIQEYDMQYMSVYSPISYLPQVTGILVSKLLTNNPAIWGYSSRMSNAIICILILYFAIKIIPVGKKILFAICLLPSTFNSITTLSADGFLLATVFFFISYILYLLFTKQRKLNKKDYILLFILSTIISLSKLVYLPLLFLMLILLDSASTKKHKFIIIFNIILGIILNILWGNIAFEYLSTGQGLNSKYYIKQILIHPITFIQKFIYTYYLNIGKYLVDLVGGRNAWNVNYIEDGTVLPIMSIFILLIIPFIDKNQKIVFNKSIKAIFISIIVLTIILISTSLYISCTPIGFPYFVGIQGRYFLPLLLPICLLINQMVNIKLNKINFNIILSLVICINYINLLVMLISYL